MFLDFVGFEFLGVAWGFGFFGGAWGCHCENLQSASVQIRGNPLKFFWGFWGIFVFFGDLNFGFFAGFFLGVLGGLRGFLLNLGIFGFLGLGLGFWFVGNLSF